MIYKNYRIYLNNSNNKFLVGIFSFILREQLINLEFKYAIQLFITVVISNQQEFSTLYDEQLQNPMKTKF